MAVIVFYSIECRCPCGNREGRQGFGVYSVFTVMNIETMSGFVPKGPQGVLESAT